MYLFIYLFLRFTSFVPWRQVGPWGWRFYLFIYFFICLFIYLFIYLYSAGPMHLSRRIFVWAKRLTLSWQLKVCLSVCLSSTITLSKTISKKTENYKGLGTSIRGLACNRPLHLPSWCFRFCVIFISFGRVHFYFPRFQSRFLSLSSLF